MDLILPVSPYALGVPWPRYWRDVGRSDPVEISIDGEEPLSVADVKAYLNVDFNDTDGIIAAMIPAARRLVDGDLGCSSVQRTLEFVFDQFPLERAIPLPEPPLISVEFVKYTDQVTGVESTMDPSRYFLDTHSRPGLIILQPGQAWPTGVRAERGGKIRWKVGLSDASASPDRALQAMRFVLAHWYDNRNPVMPGQAASEILPLTYDTLVSDRIRYFG